MKERTWYSTLVFAGAVLLVLSGCASAPAPAPQMPEGPMPVSKQGTVVETISPTEVMVEASGVYYGQDVQENGVNKALVDARKTALYTLLYGGSDPMLSTGDEKQAFENNADFFFDENNMKNYITWEEKKLQERVIIEQGAGMRVTKNFRVNKEKLYQDMVDKGVVQSREDITDQVGKPFLMVLPEAGEGENPVQILGNDQEMNHAATVIESYLTSRGYDVVVPEQQAQMNQLNAAQMGISGQMDDYAYQMALSIGSDVYLTFNGRLEDAAYETKKYALTLSAYETTTARLLGSNTGYSESRKGEVMVSIEEAMNDAVDSVLNRVMNYWQKDLSRGVQYKVVVRIDSFFMDEEIDEIQLAFMDAAADVAKDSKENVLSRETIDYILWVDPEKYDRGLRLYSALKKAFDSYGTSGEMGRVNLNRKMMLLKIEPR